MTPDYEKISSLLFEHYPDLHCALKFRNGFELLVASRLSAQCTDLRVNLVCETFFARWDTAEKLADADPEEVETVIRPCGLHRTKARDLIDAAKILTSSPFPDTLEGFLQLPGVGRKIANLLMGELYGTPGVIVADTHCIRLANRLGFADSSDPVKVETALRSAVKAEESMKFCHALVHHGRSVCTARKPQCEICFLNRFCRSFIDAKTVESK